MTIILHIIINLVLILNSNILFACDNTHSPVKHILALIKIIFRLFVMFNEANVLIPLVISINDKIIELVKLLKGRIGKNKLYKVVKTTMLPNIIMEEENAFMMLFFSVSENCNFCFFIILLESFEMYLLRIIKPKIKFDKYIDNNIFIPI